VIVLDTDVVSVLVAPGHPDLALITNWAETLADQDLRLTSVTRAEISFGIAIMPDGAKRKALAAAAAAYFAHTASQTLGFGAREADEYGAIMARRRSLGRPMGVLDAQIAAIAKAAGAAVATRDWAGFADSGVAVIDPYAGVEPLRPR
jgi:predicted nucleic acid-binding protein